MNQITKSLKPTMTAITLFLSSQLKAEVPYTKIIKAIEQVESSGRTDAIGAAGEIGCMQIREIMLRHVNNLYRTKYTKQDLFSRKYSYEICYLFLKHEVTRYKRRFKTYPSLNKIISSWNSGSIMKNTRTQYTNKVLAHFYRK